MVAAHGNSSRHRFYGVDFSGAKDAGRRIWIAEGTLHRGKLHVRGCHPGETLPGSGRERDLCFASLVAFVGRNESSVFGFDFPFGLPAPLVQETTWLDFVQKFSTTYDSSDRFQAICRAKSSSQELRRRTDDEHKTPFSAYNLRLYRQTFYGIRDVVAPLVLSGAARVLPMQEPLNSKAWLVEACPASTLKEAKRADGDLLDVFGKGYKGKREGCRNARSLILDWLGDVHRVSLESPALVSTILRDRGGDALDSVLCALAAYHAACLPSPTPNPHDVEGRVFV